MHITVDLNKILFSSFPWVSSFEWFSNPFAYPCKFTFLIYIIAYSRSLPMIWSQNKIYILWCSYTEQLSNVRITYPYDVIISNLHFMFNKWFIYHAIKGEQYWNYWIFSRTKTTYLKKLNNVLWLLFSLTWTVSLL